MGKTAIGTLGGNPYMVMFHVFTWDNDKLDEFFSDKEEAIAYYRKLSDDNGGMRLYEEVYNTKDSYEFGEPDDENCLMSNEDEL